MQIFSLYTRKVPFTEFNMFLAAAMAHYIAFKIVYRHPAIAPYERYVHEQAPSLNPKKKKAEKLPFEEVMNEIHSQAVALELDMLAVLQYDFEFDLPFTYVKQFFAILKQNEEFEKSKVEKLEAMSLQITFDTYTFHDYFLFYSPPLIAASCILVCLKVNNAPDKMMPEITRIFSNEIKVKD